jgi:peptide/nickel transport system ATP-binding protein
MRSDPFGAIVPVEHTADDLLSVENVHTWFELRRWGFARAGVVHAVDGVNLVTRAGEAVAIVGESGCGKSTLARTILGLVPLTSGRVLFGGHPMDPRDRRAMHQFRRQVGFVQQDPYGALPPYMNVRRILSEPLVIHHVGDRKQREMRVREALEEVHLTPAEDYLGKFPHMLSGGQQQRVVIARAIILRPRLLIADEPVSMLDASVRVDVLELLRSLQKRYQLTLVFITHDLSTVRHFADRVVVMYAGKIVEQGPVAEVVANPRHPYTRALLAAIPDPSYENSRTLREVPAGEPPSLLNPPPGCRFHPRCPVAIENRCDREVPPDDQFKNDGHIAACWLYDGTSNRTGTLPTLGVREPHG